MSSTASAAATNSNNKKRPLEGTLKGDAVKRRNVFKHILDDPYTKVSWPVIAPEDSTYILGMLANALEPLQHRTDRKQKDLIARPDIADYILLGFNAVNAALETQAQSHLHASTKQENDGTKRSDSGSSSSGSKVDDIEMVFVCKADMKSTLLSAHFPELVAAASAPTSDEGINNNPDSVRLIQLPAGSAARLATSSGLTQLSVIALRRGYSGTTDLSARIVSRNIGLVETPGWLRQARLMPTAIATLISTAPIKSSSKQQQQQKKQQQNQPNKEPSAGSSSKKQKHT